MNESRHTEGQINAVLKETDPGIKVQDPCRKRGVSDATAWK
jgi:putative transposase